LFTKLKQLGEAAEVVQSRPQTGEAPDGEEICSPTVSDEDASTGCSGWRDGLAVFLEEEEPAIWIEEEGPAVWIVEDELESSEFQQRLTENMVIAEVVDEKELEAWKKKRSICRCSCFLILIVILIGLVIPLVKENPEIITNPPTGSPTRQSGYDYLVDLLEPLSGDNLFVEGSAQNQAFHWLLNEDPGMLEITGAKEFSARLINRYALATFYYAADGSAWIDDFYFLSNRSICDWHIETQGVTCFENREPLGLRFST
jgi:hypothetical protein